ncbi:MAG TPA: ABC transporter substrate-binding protein/permease [Polyangiaceae bacterium]|nr:ABC transporter substrate-binding protein/permease [Polyangiaceae bacterium]
MSRKVRVVKLRALAAFTVACVAGPARADTLSAARARGELVFGADAQGGEPFVFEDPNDPRRKLIGFEVDIADALAADVGVRARFSQADWSTLVPSLERGDFDVAMNGLEDTPSRRARILLTLPYFSFGETLAVKRGDGRKSLDALAGGRIGTLNQSFADDLLRGRGFEPVLYEGVSEPYADLALGRISGVLLDHVIADRYGCVRPDVDCVRDDVARGTYAIGVRHGDEALVARLNEALGRLRRSGTLERILEKWKLWDFRQVELSHRLETGAATAPPPPSAVSRAWSFADTRLFLAGALVTLALSTAAFALALPLGLGLALCRLGRRGPLRAFAVTYIELFRGTPLLLQLYVLYFGLAPVFRLPPWAAAVLALAMNYGAYEAEIHRGALLAVPSGQGEAARALGLTRFQALRHVLLPQSFRIALPSMTNDFVALLKDSSLVSVITVVELTKRMTIAAVDLRGWLVPGLACAALYFAMSYPLSRLAARLEGALRRDQHPEAR